MMKKLKKLSREEMKKILAGEAAPPACGHGSCSSGSDCGSGCNCIKSQCTSVN